MARPSDPLDLSSAGIAAEDGEWVAITEMEADLIADPFDPPMVRKAADGSVEVRGQFVRRGNVDADA